jgi:transposase InsO family protein
MMSSLAERQALLALLTEACDAGSRLRPACALIGLSERTVQRWLRPTVDDDGDLRASTKRIATPPPNRLSDTERQAALALLNSDEFKDLPPSQIVPRLADQGRFVASESTLYRLLRGAGQLTHRRAERAPQPRSRPRALVARRPDQIYCWDISYLPTEVRGSYFYLYLFVDLFSRKIVGWQVYDTESAERASQLLTDICARQQIAPQQLTLHSDNGAPMKGETMLATLQRLGVAASRSRPAVSNDNPFSEALFRTLKYRPQLPVRPLSSLLQARRWVTQLVHWYNNEHRHSAIGFVTPEQRHQQIDQSLLRGRAAVYAAARDRHPRRWSGATRNWTHISEVHLNPEKPTDQKIPDRKAA